MKGFLNWMEEKFVPVAAKIGSNKFLISIRDAFITMMPVTMALAFATFLNVFVRDIPNEFGWTAIPEAMNWLIGINGAVWWGAYAMFSVIFVVSLGYQLGKNYNADAIATAIIALCAYLCATPQGVDGWGFLHWSYTQVTALFSSMLLCIAASFLFIGLSKTKLKIKMPESVPPAVGKAFSALIPGIIVLYVFSAFGQFFPQIFGKDLQTIISTFVQQPAMAATQSFLMVIICAFAVQILWFFGLHGTNVLGVIFDGLYQTAGLENAAAVTAGTEMPYMWTKTSFEVFGWMGGAGCTIALLLAILVFSKKKDQRTVGVIAAPMGFFNINEPATFGLPLVLNPLYFIPFLLVSPLLITIGYLFTAIGFVPATIAIPWITPPILGAVLATRSWQGGVIALLNLAIAFGIYMIFVIVGNKQKDAAAEEVA